MSINVEVKFPNAQKIPYNVPDAATVATLATLIRTNQTPLRGQANIQFRVGEGPGRVLVHTERLIDGTLYNAR